MGFRTRRKGYTAEPFNLVKFVQDLSRTATGRTQSFELRKPEPGGRMPQQTDELV